MLPDAFFAIDGLFETYLTVLDQMDAYPAVIAKENAHYLPFLMTTTIMMEAVKAGVGRETAHHAIKEHAVATVNDLRTGKATTNDLVVRLAADDRIPMNEAALTAIVSEGESNAGAALAQVAHFAKAIAALEASHPQAAAYAPDSIL
jgi:adenylosuccinate lyase